MNFTSQICTTKEQSEKLLALGLKRETADMGLAGDIPIPIEDWKTQDTTLINSPAWSLHRLMEIYDKTCIFWDGTSKNPFDDMILRIEYRIKCGELNKEYLN